MNSLESIKIVNFMSHEETIVRLQNGVATMICGENKSDEGQGSNGSGKSAILEGIAVAFLGEPLRDVGLKEMVRNEEGEALIEAVLPNSFDNSVFTIKRKIFSNTKPSELELFLNDEKIETMTSVLHGNKMILERLGISKEDLLNYFIISKDNYTSFFNMTDGFKKKTISRFANSDLIDPAFDLVKSDISEVDVKINEVDMKISSSNGSIDAMNNLIDTEQGEDDWKKDRQSRVDLKELDKKTQKGLMDTLDTKPTEELIKTTKEGLKGLKEADEKEINKLIAEIGECNANITEFEDEESELNGSIKKITNSLLGLITCPECKHEFLPEGEIDVEDERKKLKDSNLDLADVKLDLQEEEKIKSEVKAEKAQLEKDQDKINSINREVNNLETQVENTNNKKSTYKSKIETIDAEIEGIKAETYTSKIGDYKKKIKGYEADILKYEGERKSIETKSGDYEGKLVLLQKFKTYLANKAIGSIEYNINQFLAKMGSKIALRIEGYSMTSKGKINERISSHITKSGDEAGSLGKLSSGEKGRIVVGEILTFQQLINDNCGNGKGLDLTYLDEIIESVDSLGISGTMKSLNSVNKTIAVVTHATYNETYDNTIVIEKVNDISKIKS
jgi:exonuclease SbcC